jgi:hypothetical protein
MGVLFMKKFFKLIGIIALVAIIGFTMAGCDNESNLGGQTPGKTPGSGQYTTKDVLGNSYSISIGSSIPAASIASRYTRAAVENDQVKMSVKGRDGNTRNVSGKVKKVGTDGTLTIETNKGDKFSVVVDGTNMEAIVSDGAEIKLDKSVSFTAADGKTETATTLTPRTFDSIYLRANRWNNGKERGEQYASGLSVLVKDFPTNVSRLMPGTNGRYTITISGKIDKALSHVQIEVQGLTVNDKWVYLGANTTQRPIRAGVFNETVGLNVGNEAGTSYDLMDYKEVILQVTEVLKYENDSHPEWAQNYSSLGNTPNGQIMASISDFKISLKDTNRSAFNGNTNDYYYGFGADGFSIDYRQAVWSLRPENIVTVKKANAKFEFIIMDNDIGEDEWKGPTLSFIWQDPVRGLWWQDQYMICGGDKNDGYKYKFYEGAAWDAAKNKVTIDLSKVIKDSKFAASTQLNFIVACWWNEGKDCRNIGDLTITGANIVNTTP